MNTSKALHFNPGKLRYTGIIGTGGIGSGKFFMLNGDHTLGREESRSGHFMDVRDYCKQHIILHYVKVLLGKAITVVPIGKIGDDDIGQVLFSEMLETGFDMKRVEKLKNSSTLFSFCFHYPDNSGGNLTTDNSASAQVDSVFIEKAGSDIKLFGTKGIIMAAPEVPLSARQTLLRLGKQHNLFCTASFTSEEINIAMETGIISDVDLLAINLDEASAIADNSDNQRSTESLIESVIKNLQFCNKDIMVSVTAGSQGSWCWDGKKLSHFPAFKTSVISTAGAGDAFFSGLLCGLALDLSLSESQQFATLVAGMSVTSPHTIHKGIDRFSLKTFLAETGQKYSETILKLLED